MKKAKIWADKKYVVGEIDHKIYSSFLEHVHRVIYTGIYEPEHPTADEDGFRQDVLNIVKEINVPYVRYPGGNMLSGYDWMDGIGDKGKRPIRYDCAWQDIETNQVGTDEFIRWCNKANTLPMFAVNLGTGTPLDAARWVEYTNLDKDTTLTRMRKDNGSIAPYGIKYWCLGNEMNGPWQICHQRAENYAEKAREAGKMMKWVDPNIKLIACGSAGDFLPSYLEWDKTVVEECWDVADYISTHKYFGLKEESQGNMNNYLASGLHLDRIIKNLTAVIQMVKGKKHSKKNMYISVDEWNVRNSLPDRIFSFADALAFAGLFYTILRNCNIVKIACVAQLVNLLPPILTEPGGSVIKQSIFYPYQYLSKYGKGFVLNSVTECPSIEILDGVTKGLDELVIDDRENFSLRIFVNNITDTNMEVDINLQDYSIESVDHVQMVSDDLMDSNTFIDPDRIVPKKVDSPIFKSNKIKVRLASYSWNMISIRYKK